MINVDGILMHVASAAEDIPAGAERIIRRRNNLLAKNRMHSWLNGRGMSATAPCTIHGIAGPYTHTPKLKRKAA